MSNNHCNRHTASWTNHPGGKTDGLSVSFLLAHSSLNLCLSVCPPSLWLSFWLFQRPDCFTLVTPMLACRGKFGIKDSRFILQTFMCTNRNLMCLSTAQDTSGLLCLLFFFQLSFNNPKSLCLLRQYHLGRASAKKFFPHKSKITHEIPY